MHAMQLATDLPAGAASRLWKHASSWTRIQWGCLGQAWLLMWARMITLVY